MTESVGGHVSRFLRYVRRSFARCDLGSRLPAGDRLGRLIGRGLKQVGRRMMLSGPVRQRGSFHRVFGRFLRIYSARED